MTYTCHSLHLESWCKIRLPFLEASESLVKDPKGFCLLLTGTSANAIKIENILAAPPKMCAANGFLHVNHKKNLLLLAIILVFSRDPYNGLVLYIIPRVFQSKCAAVLPAFPDL